VKTEIRFAACIEHIRHCTGQWTHFTSLARKDSREITITIYNCVQYITIILLSYMTDLSFIILCDTTDARCTWNERIQDTTKKTIRKIEMTTHSRYVNANETEDGIVWNVTPDISILKSNRYARDLYSHRSCPPLHWTHSDFARTDIEMNYS